MSLGGKRDGFTLDDLVIGGAVAGLQPRAVRAVLDDVTEVARWPSIAADAGVKPDNINDVADTLCLQIV